MIDCNNKIENIKFILCNKASHFLPGNDIVFGRDKNSIVTNTDIEILLNGDLDTCIGDFDFLPEYKDNINWKFTVILLCLVLY